MISKKIFVADGSNTRFLSDFIIRSEQFCRVYNYMYDINGVDGDVDANGLYIRITDFPKSEDLVTIDKWDLVDNSISYYTAPPSGASVYIEVATTAEEFGSTITQPSVERAEAAADAAEISATESEAAKVEAEIAQLSSESSALAAEASNLSAGVSAGEASTSADEAEASAVDALNNALLGKGIVTEYNTVGTFTYTVPTESTQIQLCMIGGGGAGAKATASSSTAAGGGMAGEVKSLTMKVAEGQTFSVTVGAGGAAQTTVFASVDGLPGSDTSFETLVASGGAGGVVGGEYSNPNVNSSEPNCYGIFNDGNTISAGGYNGYGGQSGFANGSEGNAYGNPSTNASKGAGSGGVVNADLYTAYAGKGGDGVIYIVAT